MEIYLVIGRTEYEPDVTISAFCDERDAENLADRVREIQSREPSDPDEYDLWQAEYDKWVHDMLEAGCPLAGSWDEIVVEPLEVIESEPSQPAEQERTGQRPSEVLHGYLRHAGLEGLTSSGVNITDMIEYFEQREGGEQKRTCRWRRRPNRNPTFEDLFKTECGKRYLEEERNPEECPHCGGKIVEGE